MSTDEEYTNENEPIPELKNFYWESTSRVANARNVTYTFYYEIVTAAPAYVFYAMNEAINTQAMNMSKIEVMINGVKAEVGDWTNQKTGVDIKLADPALAIAGAQIEVKLHDVINTFNGAYWDFIYTATGAGWPVDQVTDPREITFVTEESEMGIREYTLLFIPDYADLNKEILTFEQTTKKVRFDHNKAEALMNPGTHWFDRSSSSIADVLGWSLGHTPDLRPGDKVTILLAIGWDSTVDSVGLCDFAPLEKFENLKIKVADNVSSTTDDDNWYYLQDYADIVCEDAQSEHRWLYSSENAKTNDEFEHGHMLRNGCVLTLKDPVNSEVCERIAQHKYELTFYLSYGLMIGSKKATAKAYFRSKIQGVTNHDNTKL